MKAKARMLFTALITLMFTGGIWAQEPVSIQTILTPPLPAKYSELLERNDFITVVFQNTSSATLNLKLRLELDGNNGISLVLPQSILPSKPLKLRASEVKALSFADIKNMYSGLTENDINISGITFKDLIKSQNIPDGSYVLCVSAYDVESGKTLSMGSPLGCSNRLIATSVEPPLILEPRTGAEIEQLMPQFVTVRWTPVQAPGAVIVYDLKMVSVPVGIDPYRAMESRKFNFYQQKSYPANVFVVGPQVPLMEPDKTYAIQITARDINGSTFIGNNGRSEIVSFTYTGLPLIDLVETDFFCGSPCAPPDERNGPDIDNVNVGDLIQFGHFRVLVDEISKSGNTFSGTGSTLRSSFFHAPINVEFNNIRINTENFVYAGSAKAIQESAMSELESFDSNNGFLPTDHEDNGEIYEVLFDPSTAVTENMLEYVDPTSTDGLNLPVSHGIGDRRIVFTGLELRPDGADLDMITLIESPVEMDGQRKFLAFGASNMCVSPGGYTTGVAPMRLNMLNPVVIDPNSEYQLHFSPGVGDRGCFADFDCDGLQEVHFGGYLVFDDTHLKPARADGQIIPGKKFGAGFQIGMTDWGQWMTMLELTDEEFEDGVVLSRQFQFVGLENYVFKLNNVWFDQSMDDNPVGITFPTSYPISGDIWQGLFAEEFELMLPDYFENGDGQRITVSARNLIIDGRGLSVDIHGENMMLEDSPGKLDEWDFTISDMDVSIETNRFQSGSFSGIIKPEIFESMMPYSARMTWVSDRMDYDFSVAMGRSVNVPLWKASVNLDRSSTLRIQVVDNEPVLTATLNGDLSLDDDISGLGAVEINGLRFEDLRLSNSGSGISGGHFNLEAGLTKKIGGFDITLDEVSFGSGDGTGGVNWESNLRFDLGFGFGENSNGFNASGGFHIKAIKRRSGGNWRFDGVSMDMINIEGSTAAVSLNGLLEWYDNDDVYGNGFRGIVDANFMDAYGLRAELLFGSISGLDYWFVDGAAMFTPAIPLAGIFGLNAFGGGAYYNMRPATDHSFESIGEISRRASYIPERNGWGFKVLTGISTTDGSFLTGRAALEASFSGTGSLQSITLDGDFSMLSASSLDSDGVDMLRLVGTIDYNHTARTLGAELGYDVSIPRQFPLIRGSQLNPRPIRLHFSPSNWFVYMGEPGHSGDVFGRMLSLNIGFEAEIFGRIGFDVNSYFDMGNGLPSPPPLPRQITGDMRDMSFLPSVAGASGVMAGLHANFEIPEKTAFTVMGVGVKLAASAGMGIDMSVRHLPALTCDGRTSFGINNWYAEARGYLYGNASLKGRIARRDFNILSVSFQSALMAQLPNPTSLRGNLKARVDLPIVGGYDMNVRFRVGSTCDLETDGDFVDDLALQDLISGFYFTELVDSVFAIHPQTQVKAEFNMPINQIKEYELSEGEVLKTRIRWDLDLQVKNSSGRYVSIVLHQGADNGRGRSSDDFRTYAYPNNTELLTFLTDGEHNSLLLPGSDYRLTLTAKLMMAFNTDPWEVLVAPDGQQVIQSRHVDFATNEVPPTRITDIVSMVPGANDPLVYLDDIEENLGYVQLGEGSQNALERYGEAPRIRVKFTDLKTGEAFTAVARRSSVHLIRYTLPALRKRRIYKVEYQVAVNQDGREYSEILTYNFKTSYYGSLEEKLDDFEIDYILTATTGSDDQVFKLLIKSREPFKREELPERLEYLEYRSTASGQPTSWHDYRIDMIDFAESHSIYMYGLSPEFTFLPNQSVFASALTTQSIRSFLADPSSVTFVNKLPPRETVLAYYWMPDQYARSLRTRILSRSGSGLSSVPAINAVGVVYVPLERVAGTVELNIHSRGITPKSFTMRRNRARRF